MADAAEKCIPLLNRGRFYGRGSEAYLHYCTRTPVPTNLILRNCLGKKSRPKAFAGKLKFSPRAAEILLVVEKRLQLIHLVLSQAHIAFGAIGVAGIQSGLGLLHIHLHARLRGGDIGPQIVAALRHLSA